MFKNLSFVALAFIALVSLYAASVAYAATGGECRRFTTCLAASAGQDGDGAASLDAIPQTFTETNSSVLNIPVFITVTGTANDTGNEAAALIGLDCADVILIDEAGGSGNEMATGDCTTDIDAAGFTVAVMLTK